VNAQRRGVLLAAACVLAAGRGLATESRRWPVAPGESLGAALRRAGDGDTVELLPGVHRAQTGVIEHPRLRLRGLGAPGSAVLQADGAHVEGKALLVVRGGEVLVEGLTFRGARVPDGNGAGIRFERGRLLLRDCGFFDNEMGVLSSNDPQAELDVEACRFGDAPVVPADADFTHLLYAGRMARLRVARCHFRGGRHGHLLKSRARVNEVLGNRLGDAAAGGGEASYELEFPNGGLARVQGNVIVQGAASGNRTLLSFGAEGEGGAPRPHRLQVLGNSFVNLGLLPGVAVRLHDDRLATAVPTEARDNLFLGTLQVATPFDDEARGNRRAPLAEADIAAGRFTLRGRGAPPGAQPE
jgi:hypothetical protein